MRTLILCIIGASSILMAAVIHGTVNTETRMASQVEESLSRAMMETEREIAAQNSRGIQNREDMISAFMQMLAVQMAQEEPGAEIEAAVCECDYEKKTMEIEVTARYDRPDKKRGSVSVRRRVALAKKE